MEVYKELICMEMGKMMYAALESAQVDWTGFAGAKTLEALDEIATIVKDYHLNDSERVKTIISVLERVGYRTGFKYDFG